MIAQKITNPFAEYSLEQYWMDMSAGLHGCIRFCSRITFADCSRPQLFLAKNKTHGVLISSADVDFITR